MTESVVVLIGRASRRGLLAAVALATLLGTGGCSSVPDAINPVEWYRGTRDWITGDDKVAPAKQDQAKPVPGSDKPFPTLASVPERPSGTTESERRKMAQTLTADREAARYTDEQIRRQTAEAIAAPPTDRAPPAATATGNTDPAETPKPGARGPSSASSDPQPAPPQRPTASGPPDPVEVQSVQPGAGQVAAVPSTPQRAMPQAPPAPPDIPSVVTQNQPIPVQRMPAQQGYSVPPAPPPAVQAAPVEERTAFVRPNRFSPQFGTGTGPIRAPQRFSPPPAAPAAPAPGFAPQPSPGFGAAPGFAATGQPVATVYFGVGSSKVGSRGRNAIRQAYRTWQQRGGRIRVVGHASSRTRNMDRVSHELANFRVSDERARAVARELIRLGVDPTAIVVEAVSDQQPAFIEVMPAGEAGNRRAEILLEN